MPGCLHGHRVLVVEDEAIIALAIEDMLGELGCVVVGPAMTPDEAVGLIGAEPLDAAVLDINLSGATSRAVAEALRSHRIPFCFSTGYQSGEVPPGFAGTPLLQKPYTADALGQTLSTLIGRDQGR